MRTAERVRARWNAGILLAIVGVIMGTASACVVGPRESAEERSQRIVSGVPGAVAVAEGMRVTLHRIADPLVSSNPFVQPTRGHRYVAFLVTVERLQGSSRSVSCSDFELQDQDGFVAEQVWFVLADADLPALPSVDLGAGQKAQGWCAFEMAADARLGVLRYDPDLFTTRDIEFHFR
jgi:hypothetical protein